MKLGIYVGSFNPVHVGHIDIVKYLLDNNYVEKVLIVPTLNYWDKNDLIDINDRINMLKFFESDKIIIDTKYNKYIYTYELFNVLKEDNRYKDYDLYLIIGADNIINFDKWKEYKELLKYKTIIMNRDNIDVNYYIKKLGGDNFIVVKDYNYINISSTEIRNGENKYLDYRVLEYMKKKKLYGRK